MGLLDDAIREHLDLKRRRGADPTEVEREEREVLGPVQRGGDPASDDEPAHLAQAPEDHLAHEPLPGEDAWEDWNEPAAETEPAAPPGAFDHEQTTVLRREPEPTEAPRVPEPPVTPAPSRYEEAERDLYAGPEPDPSAAPDPHEAPAPFAAPEPHPAPEPHTGPAAEPYGAGSAHEPRPEEQTTEFNIQDATEEGHPPNPPGQKEEDVLEETPEFLQDTPDHDRLWFEQRPPRDFDFNG